MEGMEMRSRNGFRVWFVLLVLLISATLCPHCDARKTMLRPKGSSSLSKNPKKLKVEKHLTMDGISIADSSNTQPYVNSPFSWPPFDSLAPQNSPPYCIYPPLTPFPPSPVGPTPTPTGPTLPGPSPPTSSIPSPSSPGLVPNPPTSSIPSPSSPGLLPSPSSPGLGPSPPGPGLSPNPPSYEPSPPGGPPSPTSYTPSPPSVFVPSPPVFQPPVVYPPPMVPPPHGGAVGALWCVVKPSVPDPIIQEAMNYACASGADCGPIQPSGLCFQPNSLFGHASYAFNSYWQRTKVAGGTCSFGGTAILVTQDPSHDGCHFEYF